ncbi:mRNA 3'-end-processing protein [Yarrowia sp. C11]|nr:mRNA 3'-end-processing protein [Yarrowia sp. E02]KAG5371937.1 mRNA 3'-end-processing protein [Yarrowia sp. C11]
MTDRVVYVGSIPYDQTEEQMLDIFKSVGPVISLKLMFDKETGRSKGYGFAEYPDADTARSAIRNLNGFQVGSRTLRVDHSHEGQVREFFASQNRFPNASVTKNGRPGLPAGVALRQGLEPAQQVSETMNGYSKSQMVAVVTDLMSMSKNSPQLLADLFSQAPQLAYAAVQCLLNLGLVDEQRVLSVVRGNPGLNAGSGNAPPTGPAAQSTPDPVAGNAALIQQVMALSEADINALAPEHQRSIRELRDRIQRGEVV